MSLLSSSDHSDQYFVYRVFAFDENPKLFIVSGDVSKSFTLAPSHFLARIF